MKINSKFTKILGVGLTAAMLATTVMTAIPAFADVSAVTATTNNTLISANGTWDIRFIATNAIGDGTNGGNITITFPSAFTVNSTSGNISTVTVAAGQGWLDQTTFANAFDVGNWSTNSTGATKKVRIGFNTTTVIGAGAQVRIVLPMGVVTNPSTAGSYNITVATSNDTAAIQSNNIVITLPVLGVLPGLIRAMNTNGDVIYQATDGNIANAIGVAGVSRIELSAGTFTGAYTASTVNQTIIGVGAAGTVILTPTAGATALTITADGVVLQNVAINGGVDGTSTLLVVSSNATLNNVTFNGGVIQAFTNSTSQVAVTNCLFNVTGNVTTGLNATNNATVTGTTFNVDLGGTGIVNSYNMTVSNSTFNGASAGTGISVGNATSGGNTTSITSNSFTGVHQAIIAGNETITIKNNIMNLNGDAKVDYSSGIVTVSNGAQVLATNNTISNTVSNEYAVYVGGGNLTARFNTINNTLNALQTGSGTANLTLNYWGSSTGPVASSINASDSTQLITTPYLAGSVANGNIAFGSSSFLTKSTAGVDVVTGNGSLIYVTTAQYAANPQAQLPLGTAIGYYDVSLGADTTQTSTVTIKFYNAAVTANTQVYYGGGLNGAWSLASSQGVNVAGGFVYITVTSISSPAFSDMTGTPFVLTNVVPAPAGPALVVPAGVAGSTVFSWTPVTGATSYNFQVSTTADFANPIPNVTGLTSNAYGPVALSAGTSYFWRVQSVNGAGTSAWTLGTYATTSGVSGPSTGTTNVTVTAPIVNVAPAQVTVQPPNVTVNPPQVTVQAPAAPNVTVNPPQVTVQAPPAANVQVNVPSQGQAIPTYILWTIILIGAVLVISLIVLIVRTRRVA